MVLIGIVVIGSGLVGMAMVELERTQYIVYSDTNTTSHFSAQQTLEADHFYEIFVEMRADYYTSSWAFESLVEGDVVIYIDGAVVLNEALYDSEYRDRDDYDTGVDAIDSAYYAFTPTASVNLTIIGDLTTGDDWTITIYRDMPPELANQSVLQIVVMLSGFVIFIVGVGLFVKLRRG
jgi:hypothetical protein